MANNKSRRTRRRTQANPLPKTKKKLSSTDLKKVKGGITISSEGFEPGGVKRTRASKGFDN